MPMKVLLSIKPEFANKVFDGSKKYEFRRTIFKNQAVNTIVVYSSFPVQKIIGEFKIDQIISDDLNKLWERTKRHAGISKDYFFNYFYNKQQGHAIKIKTTKLYRVPKCIRRDFKLNPPQSFIYLP